MRVVSLKAENFKRLSAIEITPAGELVQITGRNAQGKSSVLDALWVALAGSSAAPAEPIRRGQQVARIRVDLGELRVTRTFKQSKEGETTTQLTVEDEKGAMYKSPQKMLDDLLGALAFDPLAFQRMKPRDQFEALRRFVPDVDFEQIQRQQDTDYAARTAQNKRAKEARASADLIAVVPVPDSVDVSQLEADLAGASDCNLAVQRHQQQAKDLRGDVEHAQSAVKVAEYNVRELEDRLKVARESLREEAEILQRALTALEDHPPAPEGVDTAAIIEQLRTARAANQRADEIAQKQRQRVQLLTIEAEAKKQSDELTESMEQRQLAKQKAIAAAALPVPGLGFGDGIVTLNEIPFEQASDAERLRTSIAIAMAMNPKLRVIRVRDGSLLDEDGMELLAQMAKDNQFQVWVESVDSSGKIGIVIEDGQVKVVNAAAQEPAEESAA